MGPDTELILLPTSSLPENSRTKVGKWLGVRQGGWGCLWTNRNDLGYQSPRPGFVSWLCLNAPPSCWPPFQMFESKRDALGDIGSGCPIRSSFWVSQNAELAGWEDTFLTEGVKRPAPLPQHVQPHDPQPTGATGVVRSSRVSSGGAGVHHIPLCSLCLVQDLAHSVPTTLDCEVNGALLP